MAHIEYLVATEGWFVRWLRDGVYWDEQVAMWAVRMDVVQPLTMPDDRHDPNPADPNWGMQAVGMEARLTATFQFAWSRTLNRRACFRVGEPRPPT